MIIYSPESPMPAPYDEYVRQRAAGIATTLAGVVGENDVQLCPRAIYPREKVFAGDDALLYGCVIKNEVDGYKSALYREPTPQGAAVFSPQAAVEYAQQHFAQNNRVRAKDPTESDGQGQAIMASEAEVAVTARTIENIEQTGLVLMPHLTEISERLVVGAVALGSFWRLYVCRS